MRKNFCPRMCIRALTRHVHICTVHSDARQSRRLGARPEASTSPDHLPPGSRPGPGGPFRERDGMSEDKTHTYARQIWLQSGNPEVGDRMLEYNDLCNDGLLTWCNEPIEDGDLKYVRGDIADDMLAALRSAESMLTHLMTHLPEHERDNSVVVEVRRALREADGTEGA